MPQDRRQQQRRSRKGARWGMALKERLMELRTVPSERTVLGQRVWVKVASYCDWPGIIWSIDLCLKKIIPELVNSYSPGSILIRFYGDQSSMFCKKSNIKPIEDDYDRRYKTLKQWGKQDKKRDQKATWALEDLDVSSDDCEAELQRMLQMQSSVLHDRNGDAVLCALCEEDGAQMRCRVCERHLHPLCLTPAALTPEDVPDDGHWLCPSCGEENRFCKDPVADEEEKIERMGLTPDWIIHAGAFKVFQLPEPTPEYPYIRGLLDPCTNSKIAPNIPAEVLFDKNDDGLKLSNKWEGYYIVLNPDFKAHIQWRFVNRAIDEVENDSVPGVLLICRNSTDTAYFQRLMPYARVLLKRNSVQFKDYDKTPIGFGIVVFCIVKRHYHTITNRFIQHFAPFGEPNVVIDKTYLMSASFESLLGRLYTYANRHHRDHWVQCCCCEKWRIVGYEALLNAKHRSWECKDLNPPYSNCDTVQTKAEMHGARYAVLSEDKGHPSEVTSTEIVRRDIDRMFDTIGCLPGDVLQHLRNLKVIQDTEEGRAAWRACACTLSLSEGSITTHQASLPTSSQLKELNAALSSKMMQCAPDTQLPPEGFVIKPVFVDSTTYSALIQWMQSLTSQKTGPPSHPSEQELSAPPRVIESIPEAVEKLKSHRQVQSGLEFERELNQAAHRRRMNCVYHDAGRAESPSTYLKEAQRMVERAREQQRSTSVACDVIASERQQLEELLTAAKERKECDAEYCQAENAMHALQRQIEAMREQMANQQSHSSIP